MKGEIIQKSQFSNSLGNWEKCGSTAYGNIQKSKLLISFMNWENLESPTRATFENPIF